MNLTGVVDVFLTEREYKKAEKNGVSRELADDRFYNKGMTLEQTLESVQKTEVKNQEITKKERHAYLKKALEKDIKYQTFMWRINNGWSLEDASSIKAREGRDKDSFCVKEREYIKQAAGKGIAFQTYYSRRKLGWSKEKASTEPVRPKKEKTRSVKQ